MSARSETEVLGAVVALVDSLLDDFDLVELLTDLTEQCATLLDIASIGLLLAGPGGQLRLMAATTAQTAQLELFQLQRDEGPCRDAFATGRPVSVADLMSQAQRWPHFVEAAREGGFVSVHAVPLRAGDAVLGALGMFGTTIGPLSVSDLTVAQALTHIAAVAILQEHPPTPDRVIPRLFSALSDRIVVEQAEGLLHERLDLRLDETFPLLRRYARTSRRHLSDLARQLVSDAAARPELLADIARFAAADG